jgi:hypothetical protein
MKRSNSEDSHPGHAQLLLALDGELEPGEAAAISQHVESCLTCGTQWEQYARISQRIVRYHDSALQARVPKVRSPLMQVEGGSRNSGAKARVIAAFAGVAAALVCLVWLFPPVNRPAPMPQQAPAASPVIALAAPVPSQAKAVGHRRPRSKRDGTLATDNSGFFALPFSDDALPLRDATVVRVQLPIEELRLTGLAIEGAETGATIQADLLLGIDGLPRGIRLVQ